MGEMVQFKRPDGQECPAYLAEPSAGASAPAVIVIQEWWGLNRQIKKTADRLANEGFRARPRPVPRQARRRRFRSIAHDDHAELRRCRGPGHPRSGAAPEAEIEEGRHHRLLYGGALVIIAGANVPGIDAGVCFYGIPPKAVADPANIAIPMLYHFANTDDWCTPDKVNDIEKSLEGVKAAHALYRYDAEHAFMNEARPEVYNPEAAKLAWERSITFLRKHLS